MTTPIVPQPPPTQLGYNPHDAKARANAEKAYRKVMRPFHKKKRFIIPVIVVVLFLLILNSGNSSTPSSGTASAPPATPIPAQQGAAGPDNPAAQKAEAAFLADLQSAGVPITSQSTINGDAVCLVTKTGTSRDSATEQIATSVHLTGQQATDLVAAADRDLCSLIK